MTPSHLPQLRAMNKVLVGVSVVGVAVLLGWGLKVISDVDSRLPLATTLNASYDYIIVGAGSAGAVLASRLSEQSDVTVLLLEAGDDDRGQWRFRHPILAQTAFKTSADWEYYTEKGVFL